MFCTKCGCKLDDDSIFCTECGTKVEDNKEVIKEEKINKPNEEDSNVSASTESIPTSIEETDKTIAKPEVTPKDKKKIIWGAIIVVALVIVISLILNRKPSINLNDYMTITASGYDTIGKADVVFDSDTFLEDFDAISKKEEKKEEPQYEDGSFEEFMYGINEFINEEEIVLDRDITWDVSNTTDLSNGDIVEVKWKCNDERILEKYGCKVKYSDISYKVEGLEKIKKIDAFEGIELKITDDGGFPQFDVINNNTDEILGSLHYRVDIKNPDDVKNGGSVDIVVESDPEYYITLYGVSWEEKSKAYKITGLKEYVSDISEITENENIINEMYKKAEDVCNKMKITVPQGYGEAKISAIKPLGVDYYNSENARDNYAVVINQVGIDYSYPEYGMSDQWIVYYPVVFTLLQKDEDGNITIGDGNPQYVGTYTRHIFMDNSMDCIELLVEHEGYQSYKEYRESCFNNRDNQVDSNYDVNEYLNQEVIEPIYGIWDNEGYDELYNWAMSYSIEFSADGEVAIYGYRNSDRGYFSREGNKITAVFDQCMFDWPAGEEDFSGGYMPSDYTYTATMEIKDGVLYYLDGFNENSNAPDGKYLKRRNKWE